jgi:thiamine kinase-like enzyme
MTPFREHHKAEVLAFLRHTFLGRDWELSQPPHGTGQESYFARNRDDEYFIKLGVHPERYEAMSALGLSPRVVGTGFLADGTTTIVVQEKIDGRIPSRQDFRFYLKQFAQGIRKTHHSQALKFILPQKTSASFRDSGLESLAQVEQRWHSFRHKVPACAAFVDESLGQLKAQISRFHGGGLGASHNDICNGNWLVSRTGQVYLLDYESMSLNDPALDVGAILWWYYPPNLRAEFLEIAGYGNDDDFRNRMRIRMAVHSLNIILPRANSFDQFDAETFDEALADFRAVLAGRENPQGYDE